MRADGLAIRLWTAELAEGRVGFLLVNPTRSWMGMSRHAGDIRKCCSFGISQSRVSFSDRDGYLRNHTGRSKILGVRRCEGELEAWGSGSGSWTGQSSIRNGRSGGRGRPSKSASYAYPLNMGRPLVDLSAGVDRFLTLGLTGGTGRCAAVNSIMRRDAKLPVGRLCRAKELNTQHGSRDYENPYHWRC